MSTEMKPTSRFLLTQFCGPQREDNGDRMKLQVTQNTARFSEASNWSEPGFVNMTREEALELATALLNWYAGDLETLEGE